VIWQGIQTNKLVQRPEGRQDKRIIDRARAGPDFLQPERSDYAWILRHVRFIIPDKSGMEDRRVRDENKSD